MNVAMIIHLAMITNVDIVVNPEYLLYLSINTLKKHYYRSIMIVVINELVTFDLSHLYGFDYKIRFTYKITF